MPAIQAQSDPEVRQDKLHECVSPADNNVEDSSLLAKEIQPLDSSAVEQNTQVVGKNDLDGQEQETELRAADQQIPNTPVENQKEEQPDSVFNNPVKKDAANHPAKLVES